MNILEQKKHYKKLISNPSENNIEQLSYRYTLFCANIRKFLPHIHYTKYYEMFEDLLYYQFSSDLEQNNLEYLDDTIIQNFSSINIENYNNEFPLIFATFHLGSYRLLNSFLFEKGYKIALIIDSSVFNSKLSKFKDTIENLLRSKETSDLIILNVSDRSSIFRLKQLISDGYVLIVYLDGNKSVNNKSQDFSKGYIPISFFKNKIFVKNGVGILAKFLNAKIIPVISFRDNSEINHIEFYKEISITDFKTKEEFAIKSIESCYKKLEEKLLIYTTQWECWLYIHDWFNRVYEIPYENIEMLKQIFNIKRYKTFVVNGTHFIFDMYNYQSFEINIKILNAINNNDFEKIDKNLYDELLKKNIII